MDEVVFTTLYLLEVRALQRHVAWIVKDPEAAEDIAHDTLLKALEFRPFPTGAWLHRVAQNAAYDHLRRASRSISEAPTTIERRREEGVTPPEWGASSTLHDEIDALPPAQRAVTLLRYRDELTTAETGEALSKSAAAIRQLESRAMQTLRERLPS
jgi:RNA polymerase sigma-70 factor (ECF subfamily)